MKDLISREALRNELLKGTIITDDLYGMGIMAGVDAAIKKVNEAPAVDAVEVVRCYRCKHYIKSLMLCRREDGLDVPDKLDYCSYGERVSE